MQRSSRLYGWGLAIAGSWIACARSPSTEWSTSSGTGELCGNSRVDEGETCDDGNALPFDGCSQSCQKEPDCGSGACNSTCGDGLVVGEACDDGNNRDGDGCSSDCQVEPGYECATGGACDALDGPCTVTVSVVYRDFTAEHPDFGVGCGQLVTGIVAPELDAEGKPVLLNGGPACIESAASFREWYRDSRRNVGIARELTLHATEAGTFVNRFGPNGEPWEDPQGQRFDGHPLFFPLDDEPQAFQDERFPAKIPEQYGYPGWPWESSIDPEAPLHNFYFTTEVAYWFRYDASRPSRLEFTGDDDVWVFVNGKLAVDLGGVHVPETGSVTLDASSAARFGLEDGQVYELKVFHAERKMEGSTFRLTLTSFDIQRSECRPICGDGVVQPEEYCDDGNRLNGDDCPADCRYPVI